MIAVFRCADCATFLTKMDEIGLPMVDDDKGLRPAAQGDWAPVPWLETAEPSFVATVILTLEQWALVPSVTSPDFLCDFDSETDGLDWPMYTCTDGTNSWTQGAGVIS